MGLFHSGSGMGRFCSVDGSKFQADNSKDNNFTLVYDKNGALKEAENQYVKVKLERDKSGQITKGWQDYDWAANEYDEAGNCTRITSRFGADLRMERNAMGQVIELAAFRITSRFGAVLRMERNTMRI